MDSFDKTAAAVASRGYVCIAPNVRGSTGYGMELQKANYQDLGGGDLQDEVFAAKFLVDTGYVDAKKIGITGGSYGGHRQDPRSVGRGRRALWCYRLADRATE